MSTHICHVSSVHRRYDTRIFYKECISLSERGFNVTLVVCDALEDEVKENIKILSLYSCNKSRVRRMIYVFAHWAELLLQINADVYHLHDPELLLIALKLKNEGKIVIFDSHENIPMDIMGKKWIPKALRLPLSLCYQQYEKNVLKKIDGVLSTTGQITDRLIKCNKNTIEITNYPIIKNVNYMVEKERYICFAGGVDPGWMHENIIRALTPKMNVRYLLMGPSSENYLNKLIQLENWRFVDYLGRVPFETVKENYVKSLIGIAVFEHNSSIGGNVGTLGNTKIFEIMAAGLPVLCGDQKIWKEIISKHSCGISVDPYNVAEIREALLWLLNNPREAELMGVRGKEAVFNYYNWKTQEEKLVTFYDKLLHVDNKREN